MLSVFSTISPLVRHPWHRGILWVCVLLIGFGCSGRRDRNKTENASMAAEKATYDEETMNTLTEQEQKEGWKLLFDGNSTEAWRAYNQATFPSSGWVVKDNLLMMEATGKEEDGYGGNIITKDEYENFEFKIDFKLSAGANGGILYLVQEKSDEPIWHNAPEYQLLDNEGFENRKKYVMDKHRTGDNFDVQSAASHEMKQLGLWNQAMVRVNNRRVEHWLNGQKVLEYTLGSPEWKELVKKSKFAAYPEYGMARKGHIGLQDWGHQIWYRNIKVRPLPPSGNSVAVR